jgi:phage shock protein A
MLGNLYDALKRAGVDDATARAASEELAQETSEIAVLRAGSANLNGKVAKIEADVGQLRADVTQLKTDSAVIKWMLGFVLAGMVGGFSLLARLITH